MAETSEMAENHARSVRGRSEELKSEADGARAVPGLSYRDVEDGRGVGAEPAPTSARNAPLV